MGSPKKLKTAVLGGTFDHLHKGHKKLIEHGLSISERLLIGVTSDKFVKEFKIKNLKLKIPIQNPKLFESFIIRKKNVEEYLNQNAKDRYKIVKIDDMFGTTLDKNFPQDAIIVSRETLKNAKTINTKRGEINLPPLEIVIVELVLAQDGEPISSFRIRNGEINREGKLYIDPSWFSKNLYLPMQMREELKRPWGQIFKKIENVDPKDLIITVGDETTKAFNNQSIKPNLSVIDFKVARQWKFKNLRELGFSGNEKVYKIKNPPGSLFAELFKLVSDIFKNITNKEHIIIQIDGEDDLSVIPLVLSASLGTFIFYGQPNEARLPTPDAEGYGGQGIVRVEVNEQTKENVYKIVTNFKTLGY